MGNHYDLDDYDTFENPDDYCNFDVDEDELDLYDYEVQAKVDQLEFEVAMLEQHIIQAAIDGGSSDYIDRLEDELELLTMDYHILRK